MRYTEPTPAQFAGWQEWLDGRPPHVRAVAERFEPWSLYRLKSSGHRVTVHAFDEEQDGRITVRVNIEGRFNQVTFERSVFGIDPTDLEECDLPSPLEPVGALFDVAAMSDDEREDFFSRVRDAMANEP